MCCFSGKTEVHGTRIFARMSGANAQLLAYQMEFSAKEPTAMILPLPVELPAGESSVRWISLKEYGAFFTDLSAGFPEPEPPAQFGRSKSAVAAAPAAIAVHEVGDFVASFVPSMADFSRLDTRFVLPKEVWNQVPEYKDYGFAVFQLKNLSGSPHPIAFEFRTRLQGSIFFPTVHIHDGTVHKDAHFDHVLYLQEPRFDTQVSGYKGPSETDPSTGHVRSRDKTASFANVAASAGLLDGAALLHKKTLTGTLPNKDTLVGLQARSKSGCGRCDVSGEPESGALPGLLALLGLSWIIRRRNERGRS